MSDETLQGVVVSMTHRIRVYVDTSVFGGTQDEKFRKESLSFFDRVRRGEYMVLLSTETLRELRGAPDSVQSIWTNLPEGTAEILEVDREVDDLAGRYVEAGIIGPASASDAIHVASATVAGADLILSWNFRHIVNFDKIRGFNSINVRFGYRALTILSPMEVAKDERR